MSMPLRPGRVVHVSPHWRGTDFALVIVAAVLAMGAASCAAKSTTRPRTPDGFRTELSRLVREGRWAEATDLLRRSDPVEVAEAASGVGDVVYLQPDATGVRPPGVPEGVRAERRWALPGTAGETGRETGSQQQTSYRVAVYDFAKAYNAALARLERPGS